MAGKWIVAETYDDDSNKNYIAGPEFFDEDEHPEFLLCEDGLIESFDNGHISGNKFAFGSEERAQNFLEERLCSPMVIFDYLGTMIGAGATDHTNAMTEEIRAKNIDIGGVAGEINHLMESLKEQRAGASTGDLSARVASAQAEAAHEITARAGMTPSPKQQIAVRI
ncbi:MAG: hypothetical protein FWF45_00610 [Coriobacteriia bacterium]|nr:hypothetical protein [Coriobacteriia bacterium]